MPIRLQNYVLAFTLCMAGIFYLATIRPGLRWEGDAEQYIRHAMNLANGHPYGDVGFIYNPHEITEAPKSYPPVFPLLLVPAYKIFGLNLVPMKIELIMILMVSLFAFAQLIRTRISLVSMLALMALFLCNPFIFDFKDNVRSEFPFMLFTYSALLFMQSFCGNNRKISSLAAALYLGAAAYLSYGTRTAGILLLPTLFIYEFIRRGSVSLSSGMALVVFLMLAEAQNIFFCNNKDYLAVFAQYDWRSIAFTVRNYIYNFIAFWFDDSHPKLQISLFAGLIFFALSGFIAQVRKGIFVTEIFFVLYSLTIFVWPGNEGIRYFIPTIPFFIFYLSSGIEFWLGRPMVIPLSMLRFGLVTGLLVFIAVNDASHFPREFHKIPQGPYTKEAQELFTFIRRETPPDGVFIFRKPRELAFYTGRRAAIYHCPKDRQNLWDYMRSINACYLIYAKPISRGREYLASFISDYKKQLHLVFSNPDFEVYRVQKVESRT